MIDTGDDHDDTRRCMAPVASGAMMLNDDSTCVCDGDAHDNDANGDDEIDEKDLDDDNEDNEECAAASDICHL